MVIKNNIKEINKVNTLIFDIDFTLAKLGSDEEILAYALNKYDISYKEEYGKLFVDSIIRTGSKKDVKIETLEEEFNRLPFIGKITSHELVEILFIEEIKRLEAYPFIKESIDLLSNYYDIHALTDWFFSLAIQKINKMELFVDSVFSTEGFKSKRDLETYKRLLQALNKKEYEVIMIGDSKNDIHSSQIGIQSILMDYNDIMEKERDIATAVVTSAEDLPKILRR